MGKSFKALWQKFLPVLAIVANMEQDGRLTVGNHFVEYFSGQQSVSNGLRAFGYVGTSVDKEYGEMNDMMTSIGFMLALVSLWKVVASGVAWFAPPCSSWIVTSRGSTKRHRCNPLGPSKGRYERVPWGIKKHKCMQFVVGARLHFKVHLNMLLLQPEAQCVSCSRASKLSQLDPNKDRRGRTF